MNQQPQTANNIHQDSGQNWEQKYKQLSQKLANLEHEHKKVVLEMRNDLQFERKRANEFEDKYKSAIRYKNQEEELKKILTQLNETLTTKQNQILEYIKSEQEKKRKINELSSVNEELIQANEEIRTKLQQIQQGAISALLEKDNIISSLQEKIIEFENLDTGSNINELQTLIAQWEERYKELQEKAQAEKHEIQGIVQMKDQQIKEIKDKFEMQRQRYQQKITVLEQDITSYEKHIEKINNEKNHEENLEEKYYILEEKLRKTEKKLQEIQMSSKTEKQDLIAAIQKLETELASKVDHTEELKNLKNKIKELQKEIKNKGKELEESKHTLEKLKGDYLKKITQLEQEKKKIQDTLDLKSNELDRLRAQEEQHKAQVAKGIEKKIHQTPEKDGSSLSIDLEGLPNARNVLKRESSEQSTGLIQKLKAQIKSLEENIEELNTKLGQQMKEVQSLREKLVSTSGSAGRSDGQAQLLVQIQDLNSHIKKVQHNMIIIKLKYAQDESHWSSREAQLKKQIEKIDKKSKKQKIELLQRIDRMKKVNTKDKKTDYYQSSLK